MGLTVDNWIEQVRLADIIDVAIVSILIYVALVWLRDRASRSFGVVVFGLVCLFLLARWLELYLTTLAFHYGLVGILLALVIVFQQDIRNGFERLSTFRWFYSSSKGRLAQTPIDTITESVIEMARERIGALIVFHNRQPLERHLRGGVELDAKITKPLLMSIFHPESPGHDGAILIVGDRISQLGVHLPLTLNVQKMENSGTRHAAALGLAECCDAIIVVVSEERGTITIAKDSQLEEIEPAALADRLRQWGDGRLKSQPASTWWYRNLVTKATAIGIAVALWLLFAHQSDIIQRTFVIPIEFRNLQAEFEIIDPKPTYVELTLSGSQPAFSLLDPATATVSLDAEQVNDRQIFRWETRSNLKNLPGELNVEQATPETIVVSVRRKVK